MSALDTLLAKLDCEETVSWLLEMAVGKAAYEHLLEAFRRGCLSVNQTRNALHALFELRFHTSEQEVFNIMTDACGHPSQKVRSEAVTLAIAMIKLARSVPIPSRPLDVQ